jgi:hypothetical protein
MFSSDPYIKKLEQKYVDSCYVTSYHIYRGHVLDRQLLHYTTVDKLFIKFLYVDIINIVYSYLTRGDIYVDDIQFKLITRQGCTIL